MSDNLLSVNSLSVGFKKDKKIINVLDRVSFNMKKGEILGIVGESGCGKSLTSLSIMKLLPQNAVITEGEINFKGKDIVKCPMDEIINIRGEKIGMIFQEPMTSLNPVYRIGDQICEMLMLHKKIKKKEAMDIVIERLKLVSIPSPEKVIYQYPHELSGGMRQRIMIAMAMACSPQLLIADEPTTALDVTIQSQILHLMKNLKDRLSSSVLLITHDLGVIAEMCTDVVVMYAGRTVESANVYDLFKNPAHPYTVGLLRSLPTINENRKRLYTIPGTVPSPEEFSRGCRFACRCEFVQDKCFNEPPTYVDLGNDHKVSCWMKIS
ncbi:MAG: ABC transporter ATP-binding protein [Tissierellaceae bacterium]|nr:ABC transporter ATP-binding protein [Tissierellaceae bacterium]